MTRFEIGSLIVALLVLSAPAPGARAESTGATADFNEVYDLIRTHAAGVSDAELNRAAIQGVVNALAPKVSLVTNKTEGAALPRGSALGKVTLFEDNLALIRISRVGEGLSEAVAETYRQVNGTNPLKGLVLDLRYSDGADYGAAAATADLFIAKARPLLDWGKGMFSSREKKNAIQIPVAVLVNGETSRAAEALAAVMREAGVGLIIGSHTAGQAMITHDFPLKDGEELRIATAPVTLGDGSALPARGVTPDIEVAVKPQDERAYYADAFFAVSQTNPAAGGAAVASGTNTPQRRVRFNEAELVREHKEGLDREEETNLPANGPREPEKPVVNDPALARALDLLKGLAVVRQERF